MDSMAVKVYDMIIEGGTTFSSTTTTTLVAVLVGGLLLGFNYITLPRKFYPSTMDIVAIYIKLLFSPLYKVSNLRSYIKPGLTLRDDLWFRLPFKTDDKAIDKYKEVVNVSSCGAKAGEVPPLYPNTMFIYPSSCLLAQRRYLFPVLGAIHTKNYFRFMRPLQSDKDYKALFMVEEQTELVKPGVEAKFTQLLLDDDKKEVWNSTATLLLKTKHKYTGNCPSLPPSYLHQALQDHHCKVEVVEKGEWSFDAGVGVAYAKVSGDWNPIHIHPLSARMFGGFPRHIVHGMMVCAKALDRTLVQGMQNPNGGLQYPIESEVRFRRPILLPSKVIYKVHKVTTTKQPGQTSTHSSGGSYYLYTVENPRVKDKDYPDRNELCIEAFVRSC